MEPSAQTRATACDVTHAQSRGGFPDLPDPPVPKDVLAAWAILDQITFPESRPVEDAMRALVIGPEADAEPEDFLDSAIALVATLG